jgi:hypothetical protein
VTSTCTGPYGVLTTAPATVRETGDGRGVTDFGAVDPGFGDGDLGEDLGADGWGEAGAVRLLDLVAAGAGARLGSSAGPTCATPTGD